jgi:hypothetical protein
MNLQLHKVISDITGTTGLRILKAILAGERDAIALAHITATAHKLARIFYRILKYGQQFVQVGLEIYEQKFKERMVINPQKKAAALGYDLVVNQRVSGAVTWEAPKLVISPA